jgi:hypothetical protein
MHYQRPSKGHNKHGNCHVQKGHDYGNYSMMVFFTTLEMFLVLNESHEYFPIFKD